MATIKVHAGDFGKCEATQMFSIINFMTPGNWTGEARQLHDLKTVEIASEVDRDLYPGAYSLAEAMADDPMDVDDPDWVEAQANFDAGLAE